jgi:hypothetical protein
MTVQLVQFCPLVQLLQRFFQNVALKGTSHRDEWLSLFQFYRKSLLRLDPISKQKMSNFHFHLSLKLPQGKVHDFSGEVQN